MRPPPFNSTLTSLTHTATTFHPSPINASTNLQPPRVLLPAILISKNSFFFQPSFLQSLCSYLRLYLSGESSASGSPHLNRLDENAAAAAIPDGRRNIGLAIDLLRRDELPPPPYLTLDSDNGKKPLRRKNGDFIPL